MYISISKSPKCYYIIGRPSGGRTDGRRCLADRETIIDPASIVVVNASKRLFRRGGTGGKLGIYIMIPDPQRCIYLLIKTAR